MVLVGILENENSVFTKEKKDGPGFVGIIIRQAKESVYIKQILFDVKD